MRWRSTSTPAITGAGDLRDLMPDAKAYGWPSGPRNQPWQTGLAREHVPDTDAVFNRAAQLALPRDRCCRQLKTEQRGKPPTEQLSLLSTTGGTSTGNATSLLLFTPASAVLAATHF